MRILGFPPGAARSGGAACVPGQPWRPHEHWSTGHGDQVAADPAVGRGERSRFARAVEALGQLELGLVGGHLHAAKLAELAQLLGGELGLRRAAAADDVHLADLGRAQRRHHRLRDVGLLKVGRVAGQDAGHVHRDVANPDDGDRLGVEGEGARVDVGVTAVPVDEVGRRVAAEQVLARDAEAAVAHRAGGVHDRVVGVKQVFPGHVRAEVRQSRRQT